MSVQYQSNDDNKPLIIFGYDECIFKQYLLMKNTWVGPSRETILVLKDEGQGVVISAIQSCKFGFGLEMSAEELANNARKGQKYRGEKAVKEKRGSKMKMDLPDSPFVQEFEYGVVNEGYSCYEHRVLQLEDCCDVLHLLYPQYDFLLLFDHSCRYGKQRADGLNMENMSKSYGETQAKMHTRIIKQEHGYLGKYERILNPGDMQFMAFQPDNPGPFWLSDAERQQTRKD